MKEESDTNRIKKRKNKDEQTEKLGKTKAKGGGRAGEYGRGMKEGR